MKKRLLEFLKNRFPELVGVIGFHRKDDYYIVNCLAIDPRDYAPNCVSDPIGASYSVDVVSFKKYIRDTFEASKLF
ncbi:MAG: hypothetical protein JSS79_17940 [Bacteroidetes bacterium]|nr:hypothetical protein [Bacteroidota bacterium]